MSIFLTPLPKKITSKTYLQDILAQDLSLEAFNKKIRTVGELVKALGQTGSATLFTAGTRQELLRFFTERGLACGSGSAKKENPGIAPLEKLRLPEGLDGRGGDNRDRVKQSIEAYDDISAIENWLSVKAQNANTRSAYRKEAERFLLWCTQEKGIAMSSIGIAEAKDYLRWLESLGRTPEASWPYNVAQKEWIGPKNTPREDSQWRPFNSALSHTSRKMAMTIVRQLFGYLARTSYIVHNPFDQIPSKVPYLRGEGAAKQFADRSFSEEQWQEAENYFLTLEDSEAAARLAVVLMLGKGLGMRASEMLSARAGWIGMASAGTEKFLCIEVIGKGDKARRIPIGESQVGLINHYFAFRGLAPIGIADAKTPILASLGRGRKNSILKGSASRNALSRSGLYRLLEKFLDECASSIEQDRPLDAEKFRSASTHWLRHTFATSALKAMPVNMVQTALGHASVGTTSRYLKPEEAELARAMKKLRGA